MEKKELPMTAFDFLLELYVREKGIDPKTVKITKRDSEGQLISTQIGVGRYAVIKTD